MKFKNPSQEITSIAIPVNQTTSGENNFEVDTTESFTGKRHLRSIFKRIFLINKIIFKIQPLRQINPLENLFLI